MDLNIFKEDEMAELVIVGPDGENTDFKLKIRNPEGKEPQHIVNKWDKKGKSKKNGLTFEQQKEMNIEFLAACIDSWEGLADDGENVDCTWQNKLEVLTAYPLVRNQVDEFVVEKNNFLSGGGSK